MKQLQTVFNKYTDDNKYLYVGINDDNTILIHFKKRQIQISLK